MCTGRDFMTMSVRFRRPSLLEMHRDPDGRDILEQWGISHFAAAEHSSYQAIQEMAGAAEDVMPGGLSLAPAH